MRLPLFSKHRKNKSMNKNAQRGNAVVFILIAIALFGALAFTFMRGAKTGQGNLTAGQAKLIATEMISHASAMEKATNKLLSKGCSENELNFYDPLIPTALNPSAPADDHCDIFNASAGGMTANVFSQYAPVGAGPSSVVNITGTTTSEPDLGYYFAGMSDALCKEINKQLGIDNPETIPEDSTVTAAAPFTGTFTVGAADDYNDEDPRIDGKTSACIKITAVSVNSFYSVLIDR